MPIKAKITSTNSAGPQKVSVTLPAASGSITSVSSLSALDDVTINITTAGSILQRNSDGGNFVGQVPQTDFTTASATSIHGGSAIETAIQSGTYTLTNKTLSTATLTGIITATSAVFAGASPLVFEGSTSDSFETTLAITDPTADRTITIPNATGTIITHGMFSGDATVATSGAVTLATVNSDTSAVGSSTAIPVITANAKGLVTSISTASITTTLTVGADSGSNDTVSLASDTLNFEGGSNITTTVSDNNISIAMDATPVLTGLTFEGSTADSFETTLTVVDPTADRTITFPNETGTVALLTAEQTLTNKTLTTPTINKILGTNMTLDASGDISLDAAGNDIKLKDAGTVFGQFSNSSGELVIKSSSSATSALTFSGANVTAEGNLTVDGNLTVSGTTTTVDSTTINIQNAFVFESATDDSFETTLTTVDATADRTISLPNATGTIVLKDTTDTLTNKTLTTPTIEEIDSGGDITLDSAGDIILDAGGTDIILKDDGTEFGRLKNNSGELRLQSGSSSTTAISMSGANVTIAGNLVVTGATENDGNITIGDAAGDTVTFGGTIQGSLVFEGSTADSFETTLTPGNPSADITLSLPSSGSDTLVGKATTDTFTNKSIDLETNTITGSISEFNTALQGDSFATLAGSETLTNKTLTSPTLNSPTINSPTIVFEGSTADSFETTLAVTDPTADRTITFQNGSGTVAFLTDVTGSSVAGSFSTLTSTGNTTLGDATSDTVTFNARIASHFVPAANTTYDLGTSSLRWNDLYLDGSTINLGGASISSDGTVITLPSDSKIGTDKIPTADSATGIVTRTVPLFTKAGGLSSAALQLKMKASGPTDIVFTAFTKSDGNSITTQERAFFSF